MTAEFLQGRGEKAGHHLRCHAKQRGSLPVVVPTEDTDGKSVSLAARKLAQPDHQRWPDHGSLTGGFGEADLTPLVDAASSGPQ